MSGGFEDQSWVKLGVSAALAREYANDQVLFLELLAKTLESALPNETELKYRGGFLSKKTLQSVAVSIGGNKYTIADEGRGNLNAVRTKIVRGIALKNEQIPVEECLVELGAALEEHTAKNARARDALAAMLGIS